MRTAVLLASFGALLGAAGCGDDDAEIELKLTTPAPGATLTMAEDDEDLDRLGLQLGLVGASTGIKAGTTVNWFLDGDKQEAAGEIGGDGTISIPDVTLPAGTHHVYLQTSTSSASSDKEQTYTLRALVITAPESGATLTNADDEDDKTAGVQIDVGVDGFALDDGEKIGLRLDGADVGDAIEPDAKGQAVFGGVTLISGKHTLVAYVGADDNALESNEVRVEVQEECVALTFNSPEAPKGDKLTLGGDDCPGDTAKPFTTDVTISTDAGNGRKAQLIVNGRAVASSVIEGATATFKDVALTNKRDMPNTIAVSVENSDGVTCHKDFPAEIFVDCAGATCSITSPKPAAFVDDDGGLTLFLNRSLLADGDDRFDVAVQTDEEAAGNKVQLVIDGRDREALDGKSKAEGDGATASFAAVSLAEGSHTIEALCSDEHGNVTSSGELTWVVDTTACGIDITDPAKDAVFVPGNDGDDEADGVQVPLSAKLDGKDCTAQRAAVCAPSSGIKGPQFSDFNGKSPLSTSVTLDADMSEQTLCLEVEDRAGNVGRDGVSVVFRDTAPKVVIESPADGARFNAAGGSGYVADADDDTAACDVEVSVACSEIGVDVDLRRDAADGDVIASAKCEKPGSGDPELPEGFAGRARFTAAVFEDDATSATLVATQSAPGSGSATILGKSSAITVDGDCEKPALAFDNDPCADESADSQLTLVQAASRDVVVKDGTGDIDAIELAFMNTDDDETEGTPEPDSFDNEEATFSDLDLGEEGDVTITVTATDDFGNSAELSCTATIVGDLPVIEQFTSPVDGADYGFGDDAVASCNTGTPGEFGVRVRAKADKEADRVFTISVNGAEVATGDVGDGGDIDECVAVPDDTENDDGAPSVLRLRVDSTAMGGFAQANRTIHVHKLSVTNAPDAPLQSAQNCAVTGFGYNFVVDVDASLGDAEFTFTSGAGDVSGTASNGQIMACVPLEEGPNTVVLTIDGTDIAYEIDADVVTEPPAGIVIDDQPTPDPVDPDYRDGVVARWDKPTQTFAGQLTDYHLRCARTAVLTADSDPTKDAWWTNAAPDVVLPNSLTPATNNPSFVIPGRPEEPMHCAVRVENAAGLLSPIVQSTDLTLKLRQVVISTGTAASWDGTAVAAAGDVDGDGRQDILVGGRGRAELIFGTNGNPATANKVVFVSTVTTGAGRAVGGIGDINGDGLDDFAIDDPFFNSNAGRVSVFFGRQRADWPSADQNIDTSCNADLCLDGSGTQSIGRTLRAAGDFDGSGNMDFAIGSPFAPTLAAAPYAGQVVVVLGAAYENQSCDDDGDCRAIENCSSGGTCQLDNGQTFWRLQFDLASGNWTNPPAGGPVARLNAFRLEGSGALADSQFGYAISSLGAFDDDDGDDLAIAANKVGQVHYLSGRAHSDTTGVDVLSVSDLGLPGQPAGTPIMSGSAGQLFGSTLARLGDFYDPPSATTGSIDLAVAGSNTDSFLVQPSEGTPAFSSATVTVSGPSSNIGYSIANGVNAVEGLVGDLDGDDRGDLLAGTRTSSPRDIVLWYADTFASGIVSGTVLKSTGYSIPIAAASAGSAEFLVQYVGDFNGDGQPDIIVGDPRVASNQGQAILLY